MFSIFVFSLSLSLTTFASQRRDCGHLANYGIPMPTVEDLLLSLFLLLTLQEAEIARSIKTVNMLVLSAFSLMELFLLLWFSIH